MLTIRFFSMIRESLDREEMTLDWDEGLADINAVKQTLADAYGEHWREVLFQGNLLHALNQRVVRPEHSVADGDEIAFFPPMTGG